MHPRQQRQLVQISKQLQQRETLLQNHPLAQERFTIAQMLLHHLHLQTSWSLGGPLARYLITLQTALKGCETKSSLTGFIGPNLAKYQQGVIRLMQGWLPPQSLSQADFLLNIVQTLTLATVFLTTQLLGNWKGIFPKNDPAGAKKGGLLFQELGLIFLLSSGVIETIFRLTAESVGLDERGQKRIGHLGLGSLLPLLMALVGENPEFKESLMRSIKLTLDSFEATLQQIQGAIDEELWTAASSSLQLLRRTIDNEEAEALDQVMESSFETFGLPFLKIKEDLALMQAMCSQLHESFLNIFYKNEQTMTTMNQAA